MHGRPIVLRLIALINPLFRLFGIWNRVLLLEIEVNLHRLVDSRDSCHGVQDFLDKSASIHQHWFP